MARKSIDPVIKLREQVCAALVDHLSSTGKNNLEIAEALAITPARVSNLMRGKVDVFRLDMLVSLAQRAGLQIAIAITADKKETPAIRQIRLEG